MSTTFLKRSGLILFFAVCAVWSSGAQSNLPAPSKPAQPKPPCQARAEYRQFDFWLGEWDVQANGKQAGTNSVKLILGDCVIFENWAGTGGMDGKSFNVFNAAKGKWQQTWVDSSGSVLELTGEFKEGAMRLTGEGPSRNGGKTKHKLSFFPLEGGRVRQLWEMSNDEGKTWSVAFDGLYVKQKVSQK